MLFEIAGKLLGYMGNHKLITAGEQAQIAKQLAAILAMTEAGRELMRKIEHMTDDELDDFLKELGS